MKFYFGSKHSASNPAKIRFQIFPLHQPDNGADADTGNVAGGGVRVPGLQRRDSPGTDVGDTDPEHAALW
jgi:hypothetical protein